MVEAGRSALWYFGAWALVPLLFTTAAKGMGLLPSSANGLFGLMLWVSVMFVCWAPFWWVVFFLCFASGPALRHAFNLSALHAALPALVTSVLVWEFAFLGLSAGDLPPGPVPLAVCAFLGGPVSVTAVAWWEIHRPRRRHGVRWRAQRRGAARSVRPDTAEGPPRCPIAAGRPFQFGPPGGIRATHPEGPEHARPDSIRRPSWPCEMKDPRQRQGLTPDSEQDPWTVNYMVCQRDTPQPRPTAADAGGVRPGTVMRRLPDRGVS
ncbi:hypothetical protein AB0E10_38895 [Streptomyces sp. NPDC048045]|uniref:hypothetical protein n=1 Tax=Streptomyces sp. NPDC048045 TaxID=3154710 RepID=UPI0034409A34